MQSPSQTLHTFFDSSGTAWCIVVGPPGAKSRGRALTDQKPCRYVRRESIDGNVPLLRTPPEVPAEQGPIAMG